LSSFFDFLSEVPSSAYHLDRTSLVPQVLAEDGSVVGWRFSLCSDCEIQAREYHHYIVRFMDITSFSYERHDLTSLLLLRLSIL